MNFIVDAQLPKSISDFLNRSGHNSIHTLQLLNKNKTADDIIIELADKEFRAVITKDYHFLQLHLLNKKPSTLLLVKTGNIKNSELIALFEKYFDKIVDYFREHNLIEMYVDELIVQ